MSNISVYTIFIILLHFHVFLRRAGRSFGRFGDS